VDLSDPVQMVALLGFTAVEAVFLLTVLALFKSPPPDRRSSAGTPEPPEQPAPSFRPPSSGTARRVGFIPRFGLALGWMICFGVLLALTAVTAIPGGVFLSVAGWWAAALTLFGLTVRQTFKANIALGLLTLAMVVGMGLVARGP
jgi:hypothetical protein